MSMSHGIFNRTFLVLSGAGLMACMHLPGAMAASPFDFLKGAKEAAEQLIKPTDRQQVKHAITNADYVRLLQKGKVNGDDLYDTLKLVRQQMLQAKSARAWATANTAMTSAVNQVQGGSFSVEGVLNFAMEATIDAAISEMRSRMTATAFEALDAQLALLLGQDMRAVLAAEQVELPNLAGMRDEDARRAIVMGTMVIAARVTGKILDQATEDFKNLAPDYQKLLKQREDAAGLLYTAIALRKRSAAGPQADRPLAAALTADDLKFLDTQLAGMTPETFAADMAAQNLALKFLRTERPDQFKDYGTLRDSVVSRTTAYLRAVAGAAAFGSLTTSFADAVGDLLKQQDKRQLIGSLSLIKDFGVAAVPLVEKTFDMAAGGALFPKDFFRPAKAFKITTAAGETEAASASDVYAEIDKAGSTAAFSEAFFRNDAFGWLRNVQSCDAAEAGRLVDAAVERDQRAAFASSYFGAAAQDIAGDYSFVNAFTAPRLGELERTLPRAMLDQDHRRSTTAGARGEALGAVQKQVSAGYSAWTTQQLMRVVLANKARGSAVYATLDVGPVSVRPLPSPESLYAYELYTTTCFKAQDTKRAGLPAAPQSPGAQAAAGRSMGG